ncbi:MAG: SH3 domain-containing protein [Pseudomonadota bacterium]
MQRATHYCSSVINRHLVLCFLAILAISSPAAARDAESPVDIAQVFLQANQAYKEADYQSAAVYYEKIIGAGVVNGEIFYNLGNAYLKAGKVGNALLNYRKAELLMPRSEDLETNLQYAFELTTDKIECKELVIVLKNFCFWYAKLTTGELRNLFLLVNFIFWALLAVRIFLKGEMYAIALYVVMFCTIVLGASYGLKFYNTHIQLSGIVLAKEIMVRSGDSINDTVLFKLHEGAEVAWGEEHADWIKIALCDGKKGWVQKEAVGKIQGWAQ